MKNLKHYKIQERQKIVLSKGQGTRMAYSDEPSAEMSKLDKMAMEKYGKLYFNCSTAEQSALRSLKSSGNKQEDIKKAETRTTLGENKEETPDSEKNKNKESIDKKETEDDNSFLDNLEKPSFLDAIKNNLLQYLQENILVDEFNSFTLFPFVEITFDDEKYGISIEFDSAVIINIDKNGKVIEKEIPGISEIKYDTPKSEDLVVLDNENAETTIKYLVNELFGDLKKVNR